MTKRKRKIVGQFAYHLRELIEAPAWRVLSLTARRLLDRIEIEYLRHGGQDNGKLPVTFDDFEEYGLHRHAIAPAMRECIALGLLVITQHGSAGNAEHCAPHLFRLPYLLESTADQKWRQIKTIEEAKAIAREAAGNRGRRGKNKTPVVVSAKIQWRKPTLEPVFSVAETTTGNP
jgi:hypothetical protein